MPGYAITLLKYEIRSSSLMCVPTKLQELELITRLGDGFCYRTIAETHILHCH